ncbi:dihydroxyacetone kinase subunit DhaK [Curtobacterium sp. CT11-45]|uniref:dihydroxyacetone kinase subunit DhaK n=1 Tax=Curtobacterium sp. CT11-45 TaxID=3243037 RepID=UPI0039B11708
MKKLINDPQAVVDETVRGFARAHAGHVVLVEDPIHIHRADAPLSGKVGIVSGGGSGHEPLHAGFVGYGMLDAAVPGPVFTSPTPDPIVAATKAVDGGAGVLHIVKNYTGDVVVHHDGLDPDVVHAGEPSFTLADDEVELGIGIHGEPGRERIPMAPADELVDRVLEPILTDLAAPAGSKLLLLVNGMGGTPLSELYIAYRRAAEVLTDRGFDVTRSLVGDYVTSLEMQGFSLTVTVLDDELTALWDAPVETPALRWGR